MFITIPAIVATILILIATLAKLALVITQRDSALADLKRTNLLCNDLQGQAASIKRTHDSDILFYIKENESLAHRLSAYEQLVRPKRELRWPHTPPSN